MSKGTQEKDQFILTPIGHLLLQIIFELNSRKLRAFLHQIQTEHSYTMSLEL